MSDKDTTDNGQAPAPAKAAAPRKKANTTGKGGSTPKRSTPKSSAGTQPRGRAGKPSDAYQSGRRVWPD